MHSSTFGPAAAPISVRLIAANGGITTGVSRYARSLGDALAAQQVDSTIASAGSPPLPQTVLRLARRIGFDLRAFFTTYPLAIPPSPRYGITHLTSQNLASALAPHGLPRLVITVHDLITLAHRDNRELTGYQTFYDRLFDNLAARGIRRADALIAVSAHTGQHIVRTLGYPTERITVIPHGVDHACFRPRSLPQAFYDRYQLPKDAQSLLYIGSEDPRKNLRRLLDAFAHVAVKRPHLKLLKVGAARFQAEHQQLLLHIERAGLSGKVLFFDQVPDEDLSYFCNYATAFVFPSLYEGFGLPPLEAMACGTPVIASNSSALPEVVGDAALLVDPYDVGALAAAIELLLADQELRAELRRRGLARAAQFTWERAARETMRVYQQVLEQNLIK